MTLSDLLTDGLFLDGDWVETKDQDPSGDVRLIQLADIGDGTFHNRSRRFLTSKRARDLGCTFLEAGDILIARMPDPLGRACLFPGVGQPAVTAVDVCIVRPNPAQAYPEWLVKAINSPQFRESMQAHVRGTTRQRISRKNLGTLTLSVPSVDEQHTLAQLLDRLDGPRTGAGDHLHLSRKALDRFRQSVLVAACNGRLTADWRVSNPRAEPIDRALAAMRIPSRRRVQNERAVDLELPEVPATYRVHSVDEISIVLDYGTSKRAESSAENGVPVLRMGNIQAGKLDLSDLKFIAPDSEIESLVLRDGDLLFNRTNSPELVGKSAVFHSDQKMTFASYLIRVRFEPNVAEPDFVNLWLNSAWGREWARLAKTDGVSQSNINGSKLGLLAVPLPPILEQREIVKRAQSLLRTADQTGHQIAQAVVTTQRLGTAISRRAFGGESGATQ